ncbi:MAG: FtsQ-type POTRA domain-containing protein [Actinomycetota bacterium]|nr:FtsQ-type POTRA domain-containing protein [Actinomycetota bacterium]
MSTLMSKRRDPGGQAGPDEETIRLERRLFENRRRSRRVVRLRPLFALLLAALLLIAGAYVVWFSSVLSVQQVQVTGTSIVPPVQVREVARVPLGQPLATVDLNAIRERVSTLAAVKSVRVSRSWPHQVRIDIVERSAVAVVPRGKGFRGLAADGVLFRSYDVRPPGLPEVKDQQGASTDALQEAARVVGSLPPQLLRRVDHVSVATIDQIKLFMRSGRLVVWGNSSQSSQKAEVLAVLMTRRSSVIDVSVPGRPTTRP